MRIFHNVVKRTTTLISGVATAVFNENQKRSDGIPSPTIRVSESAARGDSAAVKLIGLVETLFRSDTLKVPALTATAFETVRRTPSLLTQAIKVNETRNVSDISNIIIDYKTPGTYTWVCPAGVSTVRVACWGAGGGGGTAGVTGGGGGGGGGAFARTNFYPVTPGNSYSVFVGQGGPSFNGQSSTFDGTGVVAVGGNLGGNGTGSQGAGGSGGLAASCTGDVKVAGGNGGGGGGSLVTNGGGGGGSAGPTGAGGAGNSNGAAGTAGSGGGAAGGTGANGGTNATAGTQPGGGGGGASTLGGARSSGGNGMVRLTYSI